MKGRKRRANPVVMGRRICNGPCGRWRRICDFAHRAEARAENGIYILGMCESCHREQQREWYRRNRDVHKENVKRWKQDNPELVEKYRERERSKRSTAERREYERKRSYERYHDPVKGPQLREYFRMYRNAKRAEAGVNIQRNNYDPGKSPKVPVGPFLEWFKSLNGTAPTEVEMGENLSRLMRRLRSGEQNFVNIATVDEVAVLVGEPHMVSILYPDV